MARFSSTGRSVGTPSLIRQEPAAAARGGRPCAQWALTWADEGVFGSGKQSQIIAII